MKQVHKLAACRPVLDGIQCSVTQEDRLSAFQLSFTGLLKAVTLMTHSMLLMDECFQFWVK